MAKPKTQLQICAIRDDLMNGFGTSYNGPLLSNKTSDAIYKTILKAAKDIHSTLSKKGKDSYNGAYDGMLAYCDENGEFVNLEKPVKKVIKEKVYVRLPEVL